MRKNHMIISKDAPKTALIKWLKTKKPQQTKEKGELCQSDKGFI